MRDLLPYQDPLQVADSGIDVRYDRRDRRSSQYIAGHRPWYWQRSAADADPGTGVTHLNALLVADPGTGNIPPLMPTLAPASLISPTLALASLISPTQALASLVSTRCWSPTLVLATVCC
jgi:hypothetical protein